MTSNAASTRLGATGGRILRRAVHLIAASVLIGFQVRVILRKTALISNLGRHRPACMLLRLRDLTMPHAARIRCTG